VPTPIDNPADHQGRVRTTPHVDGNWAAHVYVSISVNKSCRLHSLLNAVITEAQQSLPSLQSLISGGDNKRNIELHVSLSRPIFIRAHQKEELRRAIKQLSHRPPFALSFTSFAELRNDERTRTFLTMELRKLCNELEPFLQRLRQHSYYSTPRFHASIAWALLDRPQAPLASTTGLITKNGAPNSTASDIHQTVNLVESHGQIGFVTIPCIPEKTVANLNGQFGDQISSPSVGSFDAGTLTVRIGKETVSWPFSGV